MVVAYSLKLNKVIDKKFDLSEGILTWFSEIQFSAVSQICLQYTGCIYQIKNTANIQKTKT